MRADLLQPFLVLAGLMVSCTQTASGPVRSMLAPGARYVAMGSSFAAGPAIGQAADQGRNRCARSADNYAHQLARLRGLQLVDVSCSGATTANILHSWAELPPQIDAVTADTRLVTVTIGGNDLNYIGGLMGASCKCRPGIDPPSEIDYERLEKALDEMLSGVRTRAPNAQIVMVDYVTILPEYGTCAQVPVGADQVAVGRKLAARLAAITSRAARRAGALDLRASALSRRHNACAAVPWVSGFGVAGAVPYHPNLAGMMAIAHALDKMLGKNAS